MDKYTGNITVSIELVTPDMAKQYLENNDSNRNISNHTVRRYAETMKHGAWELNGETIAFYEGGELKDGQHRLSAIIESGTAQWMIVVRGVPKKSVIHDRGRTRSTTDIMTLAGYQTSAKNTSSIGAIKFMFTNLAKKQDVPDDMCFRFVDKYGEFIAKAYASCASGVKTGPICKKAPVIAALFCALYSGEDYEKIMRFCRCVNSGFYDGGKGICGNRAPKIP